MISSTESSSPAPSPSSETQFAANETAHDENAINLMHFCSSSAEIMNAIEIMNNDVHLEDEALLASTFCTAMATAFSCLQHLEQNCFAG